MKKKTLLTILLSFMTTFFIGGLSACKPSNPDASNESSLNSTQEDSSLIADSFHSSEEESEESVSEEESKESSTDESEEESSADTPPDDSDDFITADTGDFAATDYTKTVIVADYNTHSTLSMQTEVVSQNSTSSLKGAFHKKDANSVYTAGGGEWVWTLLTFDLTEIYGALTDLNNAKFTFDVKTENCENNIRIAMLYSGNEYRAKEYNFSSPNAGIKAENLLGGWTRYTIHLSVLYTQQDLTDVAGIVLLFGNSNCDEDEYSIYYVDNASIYFSEPTTHPSNPAGYYSKDEEIITCNFGNSFIYYSDSAYWLQKIADLNGAKLTAFDDWVPNGRIANHYENSFGTGGFFTKNVSWIEPDVIFMQDFYGNDDTVMFGKYLEAAYQYNPDMEIKIYAAENETDDGLAASLLYGVDHVDWKTLIKTLKSTYGYKATNLNDARDGWHPNEISGLAGAALMYMELYGEIPDVCSLAEAAMARKDFYTTPIKNYLPGESDAEKKLEVEKIVKLAALVHGLEWEETCWHDYEWTKTKQETCYNSGSRTGICKNCHFTQVEIINPTVHEFINGTCKHCGIAENSPDENDLAIPDYVSTTKLGKWNVDANITLQSQVVLPHSTSSSALKVSFNKKNSEVYTGEGGEWVWTVLAFDVDEMCGYYDLTNVTFSIHIKVENCSYVGSITVVDKYGNAPTEIPYNTLADNEECKTGINKIAEDDGWICVSFTLGDIFPDTDLSQSKQICMIFSNAFSDESQDSIVYLDSARIY